MSLPRVLNLSLNRYDKASRSIEKGSPINKSTFADGETVLFKLPTSGVIDLHSLVLQCGTVFTGGATAAATNTISYTLGQMLRRFDIFIGGVQVWGASCSDFSTAYLTRRALAEPGYMKTSSNALYDLISTTSPAANSTKTVQAIMADTPGLGSKNLRFLPMSAMGEVELRFTFDASNRMTLPTAVTVTSHTPVLYYSKVAFEGGMYDQLVAARLQQGPLEIAVEAWGTYLGQSYTTNGSLPMQIATQSLDYLIMGSKNGTLTNANYNDLVQPGTGSYQLFTNGTPVSNFPLSQAHEVWYATLEALDAHSGNISVDPNILTIGEFTGQKYIYMHRFRFPSTDSDEARHSISGLNSYGQAVPLELQIRGASGGPYQPWAVALYTSTIELSPGRMVAVIN